MLISALLITVSAALFFVPPHRDFMEDVPNDSPNLRAFFYLTGLSSFLFMVSIVTGVCFVENALSRAYCEADKFVLIVEQYAYKNISQVTSIVGAIIFVISLFFPMWKTYSYDDSWIMTLFGIACVLFLAYTQISTANHASIEQSGRMKKFMLLVDDNGRLLPEYFPEGEFSQEDYSALFV